VCFLASRPQLLARNRPQPVLVLVHAAVMSAGLSPSPAGRDRNARSGVSTGSRPAAGAESSMPQPVHPHTSASVACGCEVSSASRKGRPGLVEHATTSAAGRAGPRTAARRPPPRTHPAPQVDPDHVPPSPLTMSPATPGSRSAGRRGRSGVGRHVPRERLLDGRPFFVSRRQYRRVVPGQVERPASATQLPAGTRARAVRRRRPVPPRARGRTSHSPGREDDTPQFVNRQKPAAPPPSASTFAGFSSSSRSAAARFVLAATAGELWTARGSVRPLRAHARTGATAAPRRSPRGSGGPSRSRPPPAGGRFTDTERIAARRRCRAANRSGVRHLGG